MTTVKTWENVTRPSGGILEWLLRYVSVPWLVGTTAAAFSK